MAYGCVARNEIVGEIIAERSIACGEVQYGGNGCAVNMALSFAYHGTYWESVTNPAIY